MENIIYVALSKQLALQRHMDILANNIANMNTTAFKRESVVFHEYIDQTASAEELDGGNVSFVYDVGTVLDLSGGDLQHTGNKMDLALEGRGFFVVSDDNGNDLYTRNGHLEIDDEGRLVGANGFPVLTVDDQEIILTATDTDFIVAADGSISNGSGSLGQIKIVEFEGTPEFEKLGDALLKTNAEAVPATDTSIIQGMLEGSNIKPILEMTAMIDVMRTYQATSRLLDAVGELEKDAIETIASTL